MAVYFDHNATTPVHPDVFNTMEPYLKGNFGNASCLYQLGVEASYAVEKARMQTANLINANEDEIIFTSGGTESDNLALKGIVLATGKRHIITSTIEHPAVLRTCEFLQDHFGCHITHIPVNHEGFVDPNAILESITDDTAIVSIMLANNEIGSIQPIQTIGEITRARGIYLHTDAVQAAGRLPIDVQNLNVDLLTLSAHKIYGPKGVGALFIRKGVNLISQSQGGSQENGHRGGTENVPGIAGFGKACNLAKNEWEMRAQCEQKLRDQLWDSLSTLGIDLPRNSPSSNCLPGTLNFSLKGVNSREFIRAMDNEGFCLSSGSACSQGKPSPSHVIKALGRNDTDASSAIRLSLGYQNTEEEISDFIEVFKKITYPLYGLNENG